jgi:Secretion system C-terminal sorting domain/CUB domain
MNLSIKKAFLFFVFTCYTYSAFTQTYNMSTTGTVNTCSGTFYDAGGSSGNYANNQNFTRTFCPNTAGAKISFMFTLFNVENCTGGCDYLYIYDGSNTSAPLIGQYYDNLSGVTSPNPIGTVTSTATSGCLTFRFTSNASNTSPGWTATISCITTALPLTLISFTGSKTSNGNLLQWQTAQEINTKSFTIERSSNGSDFINIGNVNASGNVNYNYNFTDADILEGIVYYRLKMIDNDDRFTFSNIIKLTNKLINQSTIYPNPIKDKATLEIGDRKLLNKQANIIDANGRTIKTFTIKNNFEIVDMSGLPSGLYILKMANGETQKIIK